MLPLQTQRSRRRYAAPAFAVAVLLVGGSGRLAAQRPDATAAVQQKVMAASQQWFDALGRGDYATVDRLETDDFLTIQRGPQGVAVVDKPTQLESLRKTGNERVKLQRDLSMTKVRVYGTAAILTAQARYRGTLPDGRAVISQSMVAEVWVNDRGQWRLSHFQPTDYPPPPAAGTGTPPAK